MTTLIVIPTWSNVAYLINCIESLFDLTEQVDFRVVVVDNGSTDETPKYLADAQNRHPLIVHRNTSNLGFVKATNQGLAYATPGEHVLFLNDDVQIVDPLWLYRLHEHFKDLNIGAVGPVSNFVMGLQQVQASPSIKYKQHEVNFLIGFCLLVRTEAFAKVGKLDERFLMGGNDDMDYSLRLKDAGYKMVVDRRSFLLHYGAQSISRIGGYEVVEKQTRPILVEKWGQPKVDTLFEIPEGLK
jgi:GT2 family glycosyltransferase